MKTSMDNATKAPTKEFADATPYLEQPEQLRHRAEKEGYLFFRGLLSQERVFNLRRQILAILKRHGLMQEGVELMEGMADPVHVAQMNLQGTIGIGVPNEIYLEVQQLEEFHAIAHDPAILRVFSVLFGDEPFPHPRNICRLVLPHPNVYPTPPHQDFLYIQGTTNTWTCWFPLGDCPRELGGLAILEGSHHLDFLDVTRSPGAGGSESILCGYDLNWAYSDYQAGDIVIFHSYTVHRSLPNQMGSKIRLSCDFRYQPSRETVISEGSLLPHMHGLITFSWEQIYKDWKSEQFQYYWHNREFTYAEWISSLFEPKDKIC